MTDAATARPTPLAAAVGVVKLVRSPGVTVPVPFCDEIKSHRVLSHTHDLGSNSGYGPVNAHCFVVAFSA
jgi:hypothetical protein